MKSPKIFIACDTTNQNRVRQILKQTQNHKLKFDTNLV